MSDIENNIDTKLAEWNVSFSVVLVGATKRDEWDCDEWRVSFSRVVAPTRLPGTVTFQTAFYTGTGHRKPVKNAPMKNFVDPRCIAAADWNDRYLRPVAPRAAGILSSLLLDGEAVNMCFTDWCDDYGYSDDSIKALSIYNACCEIGQQMRKIFTTEQREELRDMLQDF